MHEFQAYSIMARALIHAVASHRVDDGTHELFPEIGEYDFERIVRAAENILENMAHDRQAVREAYKFFSDRAATRMEGDGDDAH